MSDKVVLFGIKPKIMVSKDICLVGNSSGLLKNDYAKDIDGFDDIIRFNFGDTLNKYTGRKTTIRWVNCNINMSAVSEHNQLITDDKLFKRYLDKHFTGIHVIAWTKLQKQLQKHLSDGNKIEYHEPNNLCSFKAVNKYLEQLDINIRFDIIPNCWPRTGFQAILTCLRSGCKPYLYGFDINNNKKINHYSKNRIYEVDKMKHHQIDTEILVLNELVKRKLIIIKN